jgi:hypothetical protein
LTLALTPHPFSQDRRLELERVREQIDEAMRSISEQQEAALGHAHGLTEVGRKQFVKLQEALQQLPQNCASTRTGVRSLLQKLTAVFDSFVVPIENLSLPTGLPEEVVFRDNEHFARLARDLGSGAVRDMAAEDYEANKVTITLIEMYNKANADKIGDQAKILSWLLYQLSVIPQPDHHVPIIQRGFDTVQNATSGQLAF